LVETDRMLHDDGDLIEVSEWTVRMTVVQNARRDNHMSDVFSVANSAVPGKETQRSSRTWD
jgi:hypothetical protein